MRLRKEILGMLSLAAAFSGAACGETETPPTDIAEEAVVAPYARPVALRLTTLTMPTNSINPPKAVNVYVTLPGLARTRSFLGDYDPTGREDDVNVGFNCSTVHPTSTANGKCTTNLPFRFTFQPMKFTGSFPANSSSVSASVTINNTTTNFTIDTQGQASRTCASALMPGGPSGQNDGDTLTVCWQVRVAVPFTAPPIVETVFYPAPGERSSIGLQQSDSISTRTALTYSMGGSASTTFTGNGLTGTFTFQASTSVTDGQTITSGSSAGYSLSSSSMMPDPNNNQYLILLGADASWIDMGDGTPRSVSIALASDRIEALTLGQLRGLAQSPQDVSTIASAHRARIQQYITPDVARQFVANDPFSSTSPIAQVVANNPQRFIRADRPQANLQRRLCSSCGASSVTVSQTRGSGSDQTVGVTTGESVSYPGFGVNASETLTVSHSDTNQSTASVTLSTNSLCIEGVVDLYMDKSFGTIVPVPRLEDSCNAPTNCATGQQRVLLPGQSLGRGQSLRSCNGSWSLTMQADGIVSETYVDGSTPTSFFTPGATVAVMQSNGNFVVKDASGNVLMESGTSSSSGAYLILQDDGYIDIYNPLAAPGGGTGGALPPLWSVTPG